MTLELHEIERICDSIGGISSIKITTVDNIEGGYSPAIIDELKVYSIYFRRKTGGYSEETEDSKHGQKIVQKIEFFVPKKRLSMEELIKKIINKRVVITYNDFDGAGGMLYKAKFRYKYYTGKAKAEDQGYACEFTTEKIIGSLDYTGVNIELPDPGAPFENPNPGVYYDSCCVLVNPEPVGFVPAESGNTEYLNKYVVGSNGVKYFIDKFGNAMAFPMMPQFVETWSGNGTDEITVTSGVLNSVDTHKNTFVFLNQLKLLFDASTPTDERYFTKVDNKLKFGRVIEDWETVQLYAVPNY